MKIAIKADPSRGKEIISLLESFGGIKGNLKGDGIISTYYIDKNNIIRYDNPPIDYKVYTLEEFEKEFPFKIGDKVITLYGSVGIIRALIPDNNKLPYCVETEKGYIYGHQSELKSYKGMERNITLTLDKAKEWYKKGGELREIALQAFSEKELTKVELPKTWGEFCNKFPVKPNEAFIYITGQGESDILSFEGIQFTRKHNIKHMCASQKSAEAHLAMIQLERLRDCWRQGWTPSKGNGGFGIRFDFYEGFKIVRLYSFSAFLSFPTKEMAEEFLKCFRDLIEKAGDLI